MVADPILELIKFIASKLGGKPGTQKWEVVTAVFGWGALFALLGWLVASLTGSADVAKWLLSAFGFLLGIAMKRDLIRLWRSISGD